MTEIKLPNAKAVVEAIGPLADWYRKFKPGVTGIAVDARTMMRIERMLDEHDGRGFSREGKEVFFRGFRIYVAHLGDA